jgi:hypothetical protein
MQPSVASQPSRNQMLRIVCLIPIITIYPEE